MELCNIKLNWKFLSSDGVPFDHIKQFSLIKFPFSVLHRKYILLYLQNCGMNQVNLAKARYPDISSNGFLDSFLRGIFGEIKIQVS